MTKSAVGSVIGPTGTIAPLSIQIPNDSPCWPHSKSMAPRLNPILPVAGGRRGQAVPGASGGAGAGPRSDFQRALHGRRHVAGSLGESQELSAETGKVGAAAGRSRQSHGELSRRAAVE